MQRPPRSPAPGQLGRTTGAGLITRAKELGIDVPANTDKNELRGLVEEAERQLGLSPPGRYSGTGFGNVSADPNVTGGSAGSPSANQSPGGVGSATTGGCSVASLKMRLLELGFEMPTNIVEKSELVALVDEAERHNSRACISAEQCSPASPSRAQPVRSFAIDPPLPWLRQESRSKPGRFYYLNRDTQESTWEPWFRQESRSSPGRFYYANVETGERTWEPPTRRLKELNAAEQLVTPVLVPDEVASPAALSIEDSLDDSSMQPLALEPPEPCKIDYRDDAFADSNQAQTLGVQKPSRPSVQSNSALTCMQGHQGVKAISSVAPVDEAWDHTSADGAIKGEHFTWLRGPMIGRGSLGRVFKAKDLNTGKILAVKEVPINTRDTRDEEFKSDLENEVNIMRDLFHPHIVAYFGHDYIDNCLYLYLEHCAGGTITQALHEFGPFEERLMAAYSQQILEGLEYLHRREPSVIHRDIKGSNILIGQDCSAKLADFGCSKRTDQTLTHTMRGSIPWMAPEVIAHSRYGRAADIWSFGCVVIEMGTANVPWGRFEHQMQALVRIGLSQELPPFPEGVSETCRAFILACVKRDPAERLSTTELLNHEFVRDISPRVG